MPATNARIKSFLKSVSALGSLVSSNSRVTIKSAMHFRGSQGYDTSMKWVAAT
jgi:hypothetical protein